MDAFPTREAMIEFVELKLKEAEARRNKMKKKQNPTDAMLAIADILSSISGVDVGMADMIKKPQDKVVQSKALEKRNLTAMVEHLEKTNDRIKEAIEGVKFMLGRPFSGNQ